MFFDLGGISDDQTLSILLTKEICTNLAYPTKLKLFIYTAFVYLIEWWLPSNTKKTVTSFTTEMT